MRQNIILRNCIKPWPIDNPIARLLIGGYWDASVHLYAGQRAIVTPLLQHFIKANWSGTMHV